MSKIIQIRNVPSDIHRRLKTRAALEGISLSDYLLREVRQVAERPTIDEMMQHLAALEPVKPRTSPTSAIRAEREGR